MRIMDSQKVVLGTAQKFGVSPRPDSPTTKIRVSSSPLFFNSLADPRILTDKRVLAERDAVAVDGQAGRRQDSNQGHL